MTSLKVSVRVHMGELEGSLELDADTLLDPTESFLEILGGDNDFPDAISEEIADCNGEVALYVDVGLGDTCLELSELLDQLPDTPTPKLSDVARDNWVKIFFHKLASVSVSIAVVSHTGEGVAEVELAPDATGTNLLEKLRELFTGEMQEATVEIPAKKEGKWLPISDPYVPWELLGKVSSAVQGILVFLRPSTPSSIDQLRVRLPVGSTVKSHTDSVRPSRTDAHNTAAASAPHQPATNRHQRAKEKKALATVGEDSERASKARCLQGEREKHLLAGTDGNSVISMLGGGKFKCGLCDTTTDPSRALGEGCSGLAAHIISLKGSFGRGDGHIMKHAEHMGRAISQEEAHTIRGQGDCKSYSGKRGEGSARNVERRIGKLARLSSSSGLSSSGIASPFIPPSPVGVGTFGTSMASMVNDL